MSSNCVGCTCAAADTTDTHGQLLLATRVDHTATRLRSLALRKGLTLCQVAPGLLTVRATDLDGFFADALTELSSVEAEEVRCLVRQDDGAPDPARPSVLAQAMTAPTLAEAGARVVNADLLHLFADEQAGFHALYQRIVDLGDRHTVGFEALLRGVSRDGSTVFPDVLFPAAEAAGWTNLLDRVGRTTALRDAGPWLGDQLLFVNFIPTSIYRPEVCLRTTELAARKAGVRLDQVVFEVTEGEQVRDLDHLEGVFDYYRSRGCKVALDDLGAGYSSLNLLVRLQPDVVKLDKELVQSLPSPVGAAVVKAIVDITHSYGGLVLAECVETAEQAQCARDLGADLAQGWFFGRPERPVASPVSRDRALAPAQSAAPAHAQTAVAISGVPDELQVVPVPDETDRDTLTGLSTTDDLLDQLDAAIVRAVRLGKAVAVLFLDVRGVEGVNDELGHRAGDGVLVQVAERLSASLRTRDVLSRSGDEFIAVLADLDPLDAERVAHRAALDLVASLGRPFSAGTTQARIGGDVGVALYPEHAASSTGLLRWAGAATRATKDAGSGLVGRAPAVHDGAT